MSSKTAYGNAKTCTTTPSTEPAAATAPKNKSRHLEVFRKHGESPDRAIAGVVSRGLVTNASTAIRFLQAEHSDLSLMEFARELRDQGRAINRGDLAVPERMLNAQAVALNAMFGELARRAAMNMGEYLGASETYMRLALKAQSQCRATVETLAEMKNPHGVAFVKQANIAHGPQQVNNGGTAPVSSPGAAASCARDSKSEPSKLLEHQDGEWLDPRAQSETGRTDTDMAAVGALNGPAN